jgi:beta-galactosidase
MDSGRVPVPHSRRRFLLGLGVGVIGATSVGAALFGSMPEEVNGPLSDQWLFGQYSEGSTDPDFDDSRMVTVTVPHCVAPLSWQNWNPESWEQLWVYRQHFDAPAELRAGRSFLRLDGVLSTATVYLNGRQIGTGQGGYLPLTCETTAVLKATSNVVAVLVDGAWRQDVPPDVPKFARPSAIDFYQPAGIYRPVSIYAAPKSFVSDVFAQPLDVLSADRSLMVTCEVSAAEWVNDPVLVTAAVSQGGPEITSSTVSLAGLPPGQTTVELGLTGLASIKLWDIDDPALCDVTVTLRINGRQVHQTSVRTGFREASFTEDGFFLNGRRLKLFGVNRHQWYPYVGGAMPARVQRKDAQILKNELNCNMVRCSHYPQSTAFLDACDELGILVWEEIPGWDYVGDAQWRNRELQDVRDMVVRDRNHPSIIVWGTRVNETLGQLDLYSRTDLIAQQLDPSRPCTGAVAGNRGYSSPLYPVVGNGSSVFSFNDYSRLPAPGAPAPLRPPRAGVPYLVSEAVGTLVGPPSFRRVDPVAVQRDQTLLHAWVHGRAASNDRYCGLLAWCGFDYPSGWYHSVHGVKYPGVVDFFRIPKLGAAFYQSQVDPSTRVVIEPAFYWDFGPKSPAAGPGRLATIWSNCDRLELYLDDRHAGTVRPAHKQFPHLANPPFLANLTVRPGTQPELRIDGYLGSRLAMRRQFSADPSTDVLSCVSDDTVLAADGQDATRIVIRAVDRYGAPRPFVTGSVQFALDGPGVLVGDNPFDFESAGGAGAVWLRTIRGQTGQVSVYAAHPTLGTSMTVVDVQADLR